MRKNIGIDTGKASIHVCIADTQVPPKRWEVVEIDVSVPTWISQLEDIIKRDDIIAVESTGYHYSKPIFDLSKKVGAEALEVHSPVTGKIRDTHISTTKNDVNDARALALIALKIGSGETIKGVHIRNEASISLRLLINERMTLNKIMTRTTNRAEQIAHSINPAYSHNKAGLVKALLYGVFLPQDIRAIIHQIPYPQGVKKLVAELPEYIEPPINMRVLERASQMIIITSKQIEDVETDIREIVSQDENTAELVRLWMTIPNMSLWTACACLIPCNLDPMSMTVSEFKHSLGVAPNSASSGDTKRTKKATGYNPAKTGLHLVAIGHLKNTASPITHYKNDGDKTLFAVKRKIAQAMYGIARTRTEWKGGE